MLDKGKVGQNNTYQLSTPTFAITKSNTNDIQIRMLSLTHWRVKNIFAIIDCPPNWHIHVWASETKLDIKLDIALSRQGMLWRGGDL